MSRTRFALRISCCLVCAVVASSVAAEDNWKLPNLNPFKKSDSHAGSASPSGLKLPKLNVIRGSGSATRKPSNEPSSWTKVTQGTKSFFSKTYDVLTPWDTAAEKSKASRARSSLSFSNTGHDRKKEEKKSFLTSWTRDEEKPRQPQTVSEWLAQPRP